MDVNETRAVEAYASNVKPLPPLPPPKGDVYAKPQDILVIFPKSGKMSAVSRKIYNVLAANMQEQVIAFKKKNGGADMGIKDVFEMPLRSLLDSIEPENSNLFQTAKARIREMASVTIEYESPTESGGQKDWGVVNLLGQARITHKQGVPYVRWQYPGEIYQAITESGLYTQLNNAIIANLKTYAAVALYEACAKFKTNPGGRTARKDVRWWADALSETPPKVDKKTGLEQEREWGDFKRRQLTLAMDEINGKTDISVDLIEYKTGKKVTQAQFSVKLKSNPGVDASIKLSLELDKAVTQIGLRSAEVLTIKKDGNSEEFIFSALGKLRDRIARKDLPPVASRLAYLRTVIKEMGGTVQQKKVEEAPRESKKQSPVVGEVSQSRTTGKNIEVLESAPSHQSSPLPLAKTYQEERFEEIKQLLLDLPKEEQREIANSAFKSLSPMMARTGIRKLQAGEWASFPPLITQMVENFAIKTYGTHWAAEQAPAQ